MSVTSVPQVVRYALWGKAAGRCQYRGCNKPLWEDELTHAEFNNAYIAHIVADKPDGPRGAPGLSEQLAAERSNIMLLCDSHHRLIDHGDVAGHPVDLLAEMKREHEERIERQSGIRREMRSEVICYQANIGPQPAPMHFRECSLALLPDRYPASPTGIGLGLGNSAVTDRNPAYWEFEATHLREQFRERVAPRIAQLPHVSVFALAPQPLLMLLGRLLSDLPDVDVYQRRREPPTWDWRQEPAEEDFAIHEPTGDGPPALVFSVSATVADERILRVLPGAAIWKVAAPRPHHDFVQSRRQLSTFRATVRRLLDRIKARHGQVHELHVFPAMPVSLAVEFGRVLQPKADLPIQVYDEQHGFVRALRLP